MHFDHRYELEDGTSVCAKHFASAYGFSMRDIEECSKQLKKNPDAVHLTVEQWNDSYLHNVSHDEVETIFASNLAFVGKLTNSIVNVLP